MACKKLFEEYEETYDSSTADDLIRALNDNRKKRWQETTENLSFTHSSRKAWALLKKLGPENVGNLVIGIVTPNDVASRLIRVGKIEMDKSHTREVKRKLRSWKYQMEIVEALKKVKINKAAGFDGIYPEMLKNTGFETQSWLADLYSDILITSKIPNILKKSKIIALLKPGKPSMEASSYRPVSLLSVSYKLLERLILNRIQPTLDKHIPIEQAGFRNNRGCVEQVLALTTLIEAGFQRKLKTNVTFIDLSAAYDTVGEKGLCRSL